MKYSYEKYRNKFRVVEQPTKFVLKADLDMQKAITLVTHLNQGGAFNGETPPFFLSKKEQVN